MVQVLFEWCVAPPTPEPSPDSSLPMSVLRLPTGIKTAQTLACSFCGLLKGCTVPINLSRCSCAEIYFELCFQTAIATIGAHLNPLNFIFPCLNFGCLKPARSIRCLVISIICRKEAIMRQNSPFIFFSFPCLPTTAMPVGIAG